MREDYIFEAVKLWVNEALCLEQELRNQARYDFEVAKRDPALVPILAIAAIATGTEPHEVLSMLLSKVERRERYKSMKRRERKSRIVFSKE